MTSFSEWRLLTEATASPRKVIQHLTHIEDLVWTEGPHGAVTTTTLLAQLAEMLRGNAQRALNVSVKMDGAPSLIVGRDPQDGKFFVATKGAFAKTPRVAKSHADIQALYGHAPGLMQVMQTAFDALSGLNWTQILQGDILFTPTIRQQETVDGVQYVTFKPNTIVYGVDSASPLGQRILAASIGIAFHTTYKGSSLQTMTATPGADTSRVGTTGDVLFFPVRFRNIAGQTSLTATENSVVEKLLTQANTQTQALSRNPLFRTLTESPLLRDYLMQYQNQLVREAGSISPTPRTFVTGFLGFLNDLASREAGSRKTSKGQTAVLGKFGQLAALATAHQREILAVLEWQRTISEIKLFFLRKLNAMNALTPFYRQGGGLTPGAHEGFVAVDQQGNFVKLVDRSEFSRMNFTQGRFQ